MQGMDLLGYLKKVNMKINKRIRMGDVELDSSGSGWVLLIRQFNTWFDPLSDSVKLVVRKVAMARFLQVLRFLMSVLML
jgi:hypothetical protein